jgi:hypothetical protein
MSSLNNPYVIPECFSRGSNSELILSVKGHILTQILVQHNLLFTNVCAIFKAEVTVYMTRANSS